MSDLSSPLRLCHDDFTIADDADTLRVDRLCQELLRRFYEELLARGEDPVAATAWARGADYFLRDFLVDIKGYNLFHEAPGVVRQFAGNWYVVSNLEPELAILCGHLEGIRRFYHFLHDHGEISAQHLAQVKQDCSDLEYYGRRIDSFWELGEGGFPAWDAACPYRETTARRILQ
jgi:hypothetical protein